MPNTVINSATTTQVKNNASGYLIQITVQSQGTGFAVQIKDGPDSSGALKTLLFGAAGVAVPAAGATMLNQPVFFGQGLQVVTSGTAGEIDIQWS